MLREQARAGERAAPARIEASDQDAGAAAAARENAARAGVAVQIAQRSLLQLLPDAGTGLVACNPPYGVRVAAGPALRQLAEALRLRPKWRLAAVVTDPAALSREGLRTRSLLRTQNGGIRVEMIAGSL